MKKKMLSLMLCLSIFLCGCGGVDPNPVTIYRIGDENKSCLALRAEIANLGKSIVLKNSQKSRQEGENILWFVTGWILIVPWFFMDLKEGEKVEIEALQQRRDALLIIAAEKGCEF